MKLHRILIVIILVFGFGAVLTVASAKQISIGGPSKGKDAGNKSISEVKTVATLKMTLVCEGGKLYLKLNRTAKGVWLNQLSKRAKPIGKGKRIHVTPYLSRAKGGKLTFVVLDESDQEHSQTFPVSKYTYLLKSPKSKIRKKGKSAGQLGEQPGKEIPQTNSQPLAPPSAKAIVAAPVLKIEALKYIPQSPPKKGDVKLKAVAPHLSFTIRNAGSETLARRDFDQVWLRLKTGGRLDPAQFKLNRLAKYQVIKNPGGMQRCIIPKRLDGRSQVEVLVGYSSTVIEASTKMSPKKIDRVSKVLGDPGVAKSQPVMETKIPGSRPPKKMTLEQEQSLNLKKGNLQPKPGPIPPPIVITQGVKIIEPMGGQELRRGTRIRVSYQVNAIREIRADRIAFSLHPNGDPKESPVATTATKHSPPRGRGQGGISHAFYWTLPTDIPVRDSYVLAAKFDNAILGVSAPFTIRFFADAPGTDLIGLEDGIRVELPRGGETFRPGGTFTCRWWGAGYNPTTNAPQNVEMTLWKDCLEFSVPFNRPWVESGNPKNEGSDFSLRILDDIEEGQYCLRIELGLEGGGVYGFSGLFHIGQSAGPFSDRAVMQTEPQLLLVSPGTGGEHWSRHSSNKIRWRFHTGSLGTIPGTWTITFLRWDPASGYSVARSFVPARYDMRQITRDGLLWHEYEVDWEPDLPDGDYKVRVSGLNYQAEGSLNFTIGREWNLSIDALAVQENSLVAMVANTGGATHWGGGVSGRLEFLVEAGSTAKPVTVAMPAAERGRTDAVPVVLGDLGRLIGDPSQFDCGVPVKVTVDSTDRIQETDESDNTYEQQVFFSGRPLQLKVLTIYGNRLSSGGNIYCDSSNFSATDRDEEIFHMELLNCRQGTARGRIRVTQSGYWSDPVGSGLGRTESRWHEEADIITLQNNVLAPGGKIPLYVKKRHLRAVADSDIKIYFEDGLASGLAHNPFSLYLEVRE